MVPSPLYMRISAFFLVVYGLLGLASYAAMIAALGFPPLRPGGGFLEAVYLSYANPALNVVRALELLSYPVGLIGMSGLAIYIMRERFGLGLSLGIFAVVGILGFAVETLIEVSAAEIALSGKWLEAAFITVPRIEIVLLLDFVAAKLYYSGAITTLIAQALLAIALFAGGRLSRASAVLFVGNILAWSLATLLFAMGEAVAADLVLSVQVLVLTAAFIVAAAVMFASNNDTITIGSR
ncbi:MAG: hypothetical protein GY771_14560 [bacterium]|nr:hypothetical protein [bacterium]